MKRDINVLVEAYPNWRDYCFNNELGPDGAFFANPDAIDFDDPTIINYNQPAENQPGLWCQWVITDDGKYLEWDGGEKFYNYVEWLVYLIYHFIEPAGYTLNGKVERRGESWEDEGRIHVEIKRFNTQDPKSSRRSL